MYFNYICVTERKPLRMKLLELMILVLKILYDNLIYSPTFKNSLVK